jgi:hypothetical protein
MSAIHGYIGMPASWYEAFLKMQGNYLLIATLREQLILFLVLPLPYFKTATSVAKQIPI